MTYRFLWAVQFHITKQYFLLRHVNPLYQKLYSYNVSKQISLRYKNRLFFFHKIIHIINFSVIYSSVKVNSKAVFMLSCEKQRDVKPSTIFFIPLFADFTFPILEINLLPLSGLLVLHNLVESRFSTLYSCRRSWNSWDGLSRLLKAGSSPLPVKKLHQPTKKDKGNNGLSKTSHRPLLHFLYKRKEKKPKVQTDVKT